MLVTFLKFFFFHSALSPTYPSIVIQQELHKLQINKYTQLLHRTQNYTLPPEIPNSFSARSFQNNSFPDSPAPRSPSVPMQATRREELLEAPSFHFYQTCEQPWLGPQEGHAQGH